MTEVWVLLIDIICMISIIYDCIHEKRALMTIFWIFFFVEFDKAKSEDVKSELV